MVVYDLLRPFPTFLTVLVPFAFVVLIGFVPSEPRKNRYGNYVPEEEKFSESEQSGIGGVFRSTRTGNVSGL